MKVIFMKRWSHSVNVLFTSGRYYIKILVLQRIQYQWRMNTENNKTMFRILISVGSTITSYS